MANNSAAARTEIELISIPELEDVKNDEETNVSQVIRGEGDEEEDSFALQSLATIGSLIFYLQFLGLILIDSFDLGIWGDYFGWIPEVNFFNIEFESEQDEIALLISILLLPMICIGGIRALACAKDSPTVVFSPYRYILYYFLVPLFFIFGVVIVGALLVTENSLTALFLLLVLSGLLVGYISFLFKYGYLSRLVTLNVLRLILLLYFTPMVVYWFQAIIEAQIDPALVIFGLIPITYVFVFEIFMAKAIHMYDKSDSVDRFILNRLNCCVCCFIPQHGIDNIRKYLADDFKPQFWFIQPLILFERFIISFISLVVSQLQKGVDSTSEDYLYANETFIDRFNEEAFEGSLILSFLVLFTIVLAIIRPYKSKRENIIVVIPRISHIILLAVLTHFNRVGDGEQNRIDTGVTIVLIVNSLFMLVFWIKFIQPVKVYQELSKVAKEQENPFKKARFQFSWHEVNTFHGTVKVLQSVSGSISAGEWSLLTPAQQFLSLLAPRSDPTKHPDLVYEDEAYDMYLSKYNKPIAFKGLYACDNLKHLSVAGMNLPPESFENGTQFFAFNHLTTLESLDFSQNHVGVMGAEAIRNVLSPQSNPNLSFNLLKLKLEGCSLTPACGEIIAAFLSDASSISHLSMNYNFLGDRGAVQIFASLRHNVSLQFLSMENNFLTDNSIIETIECFSNNKTLECLYLDDNCIQGYGIELLLDCIVADQTIRTFAASIQRPQELIGLVFDDEGNLKIPQEQILEYQHEPQYQGIITKAIRNSFIKAVETYPELSFGRDNEIIHQALSRDMFYLNEQNQIEGFTTTLWNYVASGLCCFLSTGISVLNQEDRRRLSSYINDHDNGVTLLELVLVNGVSFAYHVAEVLIDLGADLSKKSESKQQTLYEIALNHKDVRVREWANRLS